MVSAFRNKDGRVFSGVALTDILEIRSQLFSRFGLRPVQLVESASFSLAMVIRYALGLSASGGSILCIFNNTLPGAVALATTRHLWNAGCRIQLFDLRSSEEAPDTEIESQLQTLSALGVPCSPLGSVNHLAGFADALERSHNVICGMGEPVTMDVALLERLVETMNNSRTPVHAVECPFGVDPDTGLPRYSYPLFASSTISLGAPLNGLFHGQLYVGRHYMCDSSIPEALYAPYSPQLNTLFSDQPVIQIFPVEPHEES